MQDAPCDLLSQERCHQNPFPFGVRLADRCQCHHLTCGHSDAHCELNEKRVTLGGDLRTKCLNTVCIQKIKGKKVAHLISSSSGIGCKNLVLLTFGARLRSKKRSHREFLLAALPFMEFEMAQNANENHNESGMEGNGMQMNRSREMAVSTSVLTGRPNFTLHGPGSHTHRCYGSTRVQG